MWCAGDAAGRAAARTRAARAAQVGGGAAAVQQQRDAVAAAAARRGGRRARRPARAHAATPRQGFVCMRAHTHVVFVSVLCYVTTDCVKKVQIKVHSDKTEYLFAG